MKPIVTLTANPSVDGAAEADLVRPTRKTRTDRERYDPGGGGINVSRVIATLGAPTRPVYLAGGATGAVLDALLAETGTDPLRIGIAGNTRISHAVFERSTGLEYRFVPEGPRVTAAEWQACLDRLAGLDCDYIVVSGSLPPGLDADAYVAVSRVASAQGARMVLDTSGPALTAALEGGGVYLAKPSLGEFQSLTGRSLASLAETRDAAAAFRTAHDVEILAVTLGHGGAVLATAEGTRALQPPPVTVHSATGAGDSFLGGMVCALAEGRAVEDAFAVGLAAGTAAVLTPGTELCRRDDVWRLHDMLQAA